MRNICKKWKNSNFRKNKLKRISLDDKLRRVSFEKSNSPFPTLIKTQNTNQGRKKKKSTSNLLDDIKQKLSTISIENGGIEFEKDIKDDIKKKEHSKSIIDDPNAKKDDSHMLDVIINNIEKNSLNLNKKKEKAKSEKLFCDLYNNNIEKYLNKLNNIKTKNYKRK